MLATALASRRIIGDGALSLRRRPPHMQQQVPAAVTVEERVSQTSAAHEEEEEASVVGAAATTGRRSLDSPSSLRCQRTVRVFRQFLMLGVVVTVVVVMTLMLSSRRVLDTGASGGEAKHCSLT